jgi:DNA-binding transcriptional regulator YdaS (Cro superfamily)
MTLLDYLKAMQRAERAAFATKCGTSLGYLQLVAYGHKKASESLCLRISAETAGRVLPKDLRPDVDWTFVQQLGASGGAAE